MRNPAGRIALWPVLASVALVTACGGSTDEPAPSNEPPSQEQNDDAIRSVFVVPESLDQLDGEAWFDHPFPSDMRLDADGSVHLHGWRNPRAVVLLDSYVQAMAGQLKGFSPAAAGYVRFTGPLDPSTLPSDPDAARQPSSSVQLIDIDDQSPELGQRKLVTLHWREQPGAYWLSNTLAFMPTMGFPLRPSTRYALVVTDALRAADATVIKPSEDLQQVLGLKTAEARTQALQQAWAPAIEALKGAGIAPEKIVHLAVFTTADPIAETVALANDARTRQPPATVDQAKWKLHTQGAVFDIYEGVYGPSPDYQAGKPPFQMEGDGGGFRFNEQNVPIKQREFWPRFSLTIPKSDRCPMPQQGYPIVLYAHGTGGDYLSFVHDGTAARLANQCLAGMGVDQIMHAERLPDVPDANWMPETLFFNFQNIEAARANLRQSAIDEVVRSRMVRESGIEVPAQVSTTGAPIRIDGTRLMFFGHSQGGLNGSLFLALDDGVRGGVLSGSGAMMAITLLEKTKPLPSVAGLVRVLLALHPSEYEELNFLHPAVSLMQAVVDVADPLHYTPHIVTEPLPGLAPKSVYQTEGVNADFTGDSYTPPHAIEVQAVAMGLPLMAPVIHPVEEMQYTGNGPITIGAEGLSGNLHQGQATGVLAQWPADKASDGHFVIFDIPEAMAQATGFLRSLADEKPGRIPAP